jgi:hypothetical protein
MQAPRETFHLVNMMLDRKLLAPPTDLLMACQDFATSKNTKVLMSAIDAALLIASRFIQALSDRSFGIVQVSRGGIRASVTQITLIGLFPAPKPGRTGTRGRSSADL